MSQPDVAHAGRHSAEVSAIALCGNLLSQAAGEGSACAEPAGHDLNDWHRNANRTMSWGNPPARRIAFCRRCLGKRTFERTAEVRTNQTWSWRFLDAAGHETTPG